MNILGLMSGSSIDGLDLALCTFDLSDKDNYSYQLLASKVFEIPDNLAKRLSTATTLTGKDLCHLDALFSEFVGQCCLEFKQEHSFQVDYISSHGHTIFHFPEMGFTTQLGNGGIISQISKTHTIADFRSSDIAAGGQGAPFAPIADKLLFPDIDFMLNLGGISNISIKIGHEIRAFDCSPANQLLNYLAAKEGLIYDKDGVQARKGTLNLQLLNQLKEANQLENAKPRGLDNSWVRENFFHLLDHCPTSDALRTCVEFITDEVVKSIELADQNCKGKSLMATGGGALNVFLMEVLEGKLRKLKIEMEVASRETINFKEAILMAFMGYLRIDQKVNVLRSYTGAKKNTIGGSIYLYE